MWEKAERVAEGFREKITPKEQIIERQAGLDQKSKKLFSNHLYIYLGVMGFLLIINVMTYGGYFWFLWPALCWGVVLFIHWRSQEFASKLIFSTSEEDRDSISSKKRLITLILCALFGVFGAHRFYVGKAGSGFVQLITIGGLGIWYLIDCIIVIFGEFTDGEGKKIRDWL
jgi:hypothetical protein